MRKDHLARQADSSSPDLVQEPVRRKPRWFWGVAFLLIAAVVSSYLVVQQPDWFKFGDQLPSDAHPSRDIDGDGPANEDVDGDGLANEVESLGWVTASGQKYQTDPEDADTDGDGLTDGDEAGLKSTSLHSKRSGYRAFSNPTKPDSDGDGLNDAQEADLSLDPFERDSDEDGLEDGEESEVVGTSPDLADTDGDGFEDGYEALHRNDKGLDPLVADEKTDARAYVTDFAIGSLAGDFMRRDSLAWFAGNLTSSGISFIPFGGWIIGAIADLRDTIAVAIRGDWVGSGFNAIGLVPYAGDSVAIPSKAAKFVARNPELAAGVAALVVSVEKVSDGIKVKALKRVWTRWDVLKAEGFPDKSLLVLSKGSTHFDSLASAMQRANHVPGATAKFFKNGQAGEGWLSRNLKNSRSQVRMATEGCPGSCNASSIRIIDTCVGGDADTCIGGVAHESKVGYKYLTPDLERQIRSDAYLQEAGKIKGAHWHFFASSHTNQLGASKKVLDLLDELDIPFTIHVPK